MSTVRQYGPAWIAAEALAWLLFPIGLLWMVYDRGSRWLGRTPHGRVARMVRWYPEAWRAQHGEEFGALLTDAVAAGEDGPRLWLDVAREAAAVRLESAFRACRTWVATELLTIRPRWTWVETTVWTVGVLAIHALVLGLVLGASWAAAVLPIAAGAALIAAALRLLRPPSVRA
jgi:hypothetical protein